MGVDAVSRFGHIDFSSFIGKQRKDPQERLLAMDNFRNSVARTKI